MAFAAGLGCRSDPGLPPAGIIGRSRCRGRRQCDDQSGSGRSQRGGAQDRTGCPAAAMSAHE
ncbi:hypothetical protein EBESD8_58600 [Rhodococcus aetherivorans]|nr:hypothetical protein EBESD8_58600 [Rhodococcus aetherivorans]